MQAGKREEGRDTLWTAVSRSQVARQTRNEGARKGERKNGGNATEILGG